RAPGRRGPPRGDARTAADGRGGDRARDRLARRLRLLDGELDAPARRGRLADGDLQRDHRPRAAGPGEAGGAGPVPRPPRPCSGGVAGQDGRARGADGDERPARSLDRLRLRWARRACGRGEAARPGRDPARRDRRGHVCPGPVRAGAARSGPADPHRRRSADLQLPALATRVRRARLRRDAVAGFRRGRVARRAQRVCESRAPFRRQVMSSFWSRIVVGAVLLPAVLGFVYLGGWWLWVLAVVAALIALHELYRLTRPLRPLVLAGYAGTLLLTVFAADAFAYFVGLLIGRHKMAPVLSPGKTWEGLVAGTIVAVLLPFFAFYHQHFLTIGESLALGVVIAVVAPLGDLFESALKRDMNVKDSGRL